MKKGQSLAQNASPVFGTPSKSSFSPASQSSLQTSRTGMPKAGGLWPKLLERDNDGVTPHRPAHECCPVVSRSHGIRDAERDLRELRLGWDCCHVLDRHDGYVPSHVLQFEAR